MIKAHLRVIDEARISGGGQNGIGIDDIGIRQAGREFGKRDIRQAIARAVAADAAFGEPQRLNSRFRQIVDEDGRGGRRSDGAQEVMRMRDILLMRGDAVRLVSGDQIAGAQGSDDDRIMRPFGKEAQIIGKGGRDRQVDAARLGLGLRKPPSIWISQSPRRMTLSFAVAVLARMP